MLLQAAVFIQFLFGKLGHIVLQDDPLSCNMFTFRGWETEMIECDRPLCTWHVAPEEHLGEASQQTLMQ